MSDEQLVTAVRHQLEAYGLLLDEAAFVRVVEGSIRGELDGLAIDLSIGEESSDVLIVLVGLDEASQRAIPFAWGETSAMRNAVEFIQELGELLEAAAVGYAVDKAKLN